MADLISQWVNHVATMFVNGGAVEFVASIPLDPSHPFFTTVKQALANTPIDGLDSDRIKKSCGGVPPNSRDTFASLIVAVLKGVKGHEEGAGDDEVVVVGDFQRLVHVHVEANRLYATTNADGSFAYSFLNPFILALCRTLYKYGSRAAYVSTQPPRSSASPRSIRDTTRQTIEKSFQISSSSQTDPEWSDSVYKPYAVGDLVWPVANLLWRIYAERKLHSQAVELQKAVASMAPSEDLRLNTRGQVLRQTDLCESYYWRGRLGVVLLDIRTAKAWLDKAWATCPGGAWQQRRAVLIRLVPVNLLLGRLPRPSLLQEYRLEAFAPLLHAYRTGNIAAWRRELHVNRNWYRSRSIWLLLFERGEILIWRNLFRRALKTYYALEPSATRNRCPTWVLLSAINGAFEGSGEVEDGQLVIEDVICVISSLIDHGLILGYLSYSQKTLVMKPGNDGLAGFPPVHAVEPRAIQANA